MMRLFINKDTDIFSEEIRLISNNEDSPLQWLLGAYGFSEKLLMDNTMYMGVLMGGPMDINMVSDIDSKGIAIFGDISYLLFDKLELSAGLRYDYIRRDIDYRRFMGGFRDLNGEDSKSFTAWLPKVSVSYRFTDEVMAYATVSKGFREGGYNINEGIGNPYESEYAVNYEIGAKTRLLDNRLTANLALFRIDWTNRQVEIMHPGGFYVDNAGKAVSQGMELEIAARPVDGLTLEGSIGFTDIEYKEYEPGVGIDYKGNKAIDSPRYTSRLSAAYQHPSGFNMALSWSGFGKVYFDPENTVDQKSYSLVDATLGYKWEHFSLDLWAHNLFNTQYVTRGVNNGLTPDYFGRFGQPRTIGLRLTGYF
jgi:iron complex outermembrane receptor protein